MASTTQVTYYELLEVPADAPVEDITRAYKVKRRDAHPDRGGSSALWRLYEQAYEILKDPAKRARYDQELAGDPAPGAGGAGTPPAGGSSRTGGTRRTSSADPGTDADDPAISGDSPPHWGHKDGPAQIYFPRLGQPPADDDPRLVHVHRRRGAKVAMRTWWTLAALVAVLGSALTIVGTVHNRSSAGYAVKNIVDITSFMLVPPAAVLALRRGKQRQARRWNAGVAAADAQLDLMMDAASSARKEWGTPGNVPQGRFGPRAAAGNAGEKATAADLARWMTHVPAARVLHGLHWPGTVHADIDHVVVVGNRVALIDSKVWGRGHFYWDGTHVYREGQVMPELKVQAAAAAVAVALRAALPASVPVEVRAWVVIRGNGVHLEGMSRPGAPMVQPQRLRDELARWLVDSNPSAAFVDRRIVLELTRLVKGRTRN